MLSRQPGPFVEMPRLLSRAGRRHARCNTDAASTARVTARFAPCAVRQEGFVPRRRCSGSEVKPLRPLSSSAGILRHVSDEQDDEGRPPRVFVSYSHDSDDHRYKVRLLVEALRRSYVFAWFDQYVEDDRPPGNWPNWMRQELTKADYVVMVCTETYTRRVEDEEKPGQGFGARWEGAIISNALYRAQRLADPNRYMPVVFQSEDRRHIPYFVEQATHYLVDPETEQGVDQLVRRIKRQPLLVPIPLGGGLPERPAQALERQTFDDVSTVDSVRAVVTRSPSWPSEEDSGKAKTAFVRTGILKWETLDEEQREEYVRNLTAAERQVLYDSLSESDRSRWDDLTLESSSEYTRAAAIARRLSTKGVKPHPLGEVPFPEAQAMQVQPTDLELEGLLFDALVAAQQHSEDSDVFFLYLGRVSAQLGKLIGRQMNRKIQVEIWDTVMRQDGPVAR